MSNNKQFNTVPTIHASRSRFDLSFDHKMSGSVGTLYPCYLQEIYPGDTFSCKANIVTRLTSTYLRPVMDNLFLDMYFFFVPSRLCYDKWQQVFGENRESAWAQQEEVLVPTATSGTIASKSVGDYLGLPVGTVPAGVNILPFRAFALIYDQWFRDENLCEPMLVQKGARTVSEQYNNNAWGPGNYFGKLPKVAKFHDLFTSSLPSTQKGTDVTVPLGSIAKVLPMGDPYSQTDVAKYFFPWDKGALGLETDNQNDVTLGAKQSIASTNYHAVERSNGGGFTASNGGIKGWNLYADLASAQGGLNVPEIRYAFQLQKILERSARAGTRYTEYILSAFGVSSPDARLQRPEYLGGKRMPLSVQQAVQSVRGEDNQLGALGGFSLSNNVCGYSKGFVEHGFVVGVMCIRQHHTYQQGIPKLFQRHSRFDYYDPILANISEQPVYRSEIFTDETSVALDDTVFGYQEAWYDLRSRPSTIAGDMRSASSTSLDIWHYGDDYSVAPTLSQAFIEETPAFVDRTIAVKSTALDQFIFDIYYQQSAVRCLPTYSIPGLVDHH